MKKSFLISLFALLCVFSAQAYVPYDFVSGGIYYQHIFGTDDQVEVTYKEYTNDDYVNDYSGSVVIPATVTFNGKTYIVTSIGNHAFDGCSGLISVTIPESVTEIGRSAFSGCSGLTSVTIPESVTSIEDYTFSDCSGLTSVTIPESVTSIGTWAFRNCSGLTSVTIPESVTSIEDYAFVGCTSITDPVYNSKIFAYMPQNYSGEYAIPSGIQSIVRAAFSGCSGLTSVTIPESVTSIEDYTFLDCSGLTSVTIPESVTEIGSSAFEGCTGLASVTIPESVTEIGSSAFEGCTGLASVTIPESVTYIGTWAFRNCSGLTSVTIPESVTSIGNYAFEGCTSITDPVYNSKIFAYMPRNYSGEYVISSGIQSIAGGAFEGCTGLASVTIPESVTSIGSSAFEGCTGLASVEWNAVACEYFSYGSPFDNCENITSFTFGEQVKRIPAYLCEEMNKLTSVTWNAVACEDFEYYDDYYYSPFSDCENITSFTFGNQVEHIPAYLCYEMDKLSSVTLPESVTSIGESAFSGCNGLTKVTSLAKMPPSCSDYTFGKESYYTIPLYVPSGSKAFYSAAEGWRKFAKIEDLEVITYTVRVQPNDAAMGLVIGGGEYKDGEQAMLAAIPNKGYYFEKWDDGSTANPRILTVTSDTTITAIFVKDGATANENSDADNFRVYVQDRTIHLSEERGAVQVYNVAGQCVYNGHSTAIPVSQSGVYIVAVNGQRLKVVVR